MNLFHTPLRSIALTQQIVFSTSRFKSKPKSPILRNKNNSSSKESALVVEARKSEAAELFEEALQYEQDDKEIAEIYLNYKHSFAATKFEKQQRKTLAKKKPKAITTLGEALSKQLIVLPVRSKATQTDFVWKKMAFRWRHAKIMWASFMNESDFYRKDSKLERDLIESFKAKYPDLFQGLNMFQVNLLTDILVELHRTDGQLDLLNEDMLDELPPGIDQALRSVQGDISGILTGRDSAPTVDAIAAVSGGAVGAAGRYSVIPGDTSTISGLPDASMAEIMSTQDVATADRFDEKDRARLEEMVETQMRLMQRVSYCGQTDKCVDTRDLRFDPYNLRINRRF